jgi:hypothetical protein
MHSLTCHPSTACPLALKITSDVIYLTNGDLQLRYYLQGQLDKLIIPLLSRSEQKDNLWQQCCFEAFVCLKGETGYYEYNFSPSRQWGLYTFTDYREVASYQPQGVPKIEVTLIGQQLTLKVILPNRILPKNPTNKSIQIALSAVIETKQQQKSYWALHHPQDKPDFHIHSEDSVINLGRKV